MVSSWVNVAEGGLSNTGAGNHVPPTSDESIPGSVMDVYDVSRG